MVARTRLYDVYGSNVVFGGVNHLFDAHTRQTYAKYASAFQCDFYMAFNHRCNVFRNSVYPDIRMMAAGKEEVEQRGLEEERNVRIGSI